MSMPRDRQHDSGLVARGQGATWEFGLGFMLDPSLGGPHDHRMHPACRRRHAAMARDDPRVPEPSDALRRMPDRLLPYHRGRLSRTRRRSRCVSGRDQDGCPFTWHRLPVPNLTGPAQLGEPSASSSSLCGSRIMIFWRPPAMSPWLSQALRTRLTVNSVAPVISATS